MHQYRLREQLEHGNLARPWHLYTLGRPQRTVFPCHWHPEWELLVVERGALELTRNQSVVRLGEGEVVFLTGTELHGATSDDDELSLAAFVFHPQLLRSELRDAATSLWVTPLEAGTVRVGSVLNAGSPAATLAKSLVEVVRSNRPGMELNVKGLLFQFLAELIAEDRFEPGEAPSTADPLPRIRSTLQWIEEQFARPLTVESLASQAHLSPSHFTRLFKAYTGETPLQHLIRCRIDEAERLLRRGQLSVSQVAVAVGFTNFSHFTRTFRVHRNLTPSEFLAATRVPKSDTGPTAPANSSE